MSEPEDDSMSIGSGSAAVDGIMDYDVEHFERELEELLDALEDEEVFHDCEEEGAPAAMATSSLPTADGIFEASDEDIAPSAAMPLLDVEDQEARTGARKRPAAMLNMQMDEPKDLRRRLRGKQPASVELYPVTEVALRMFPALAFLGARKRPAAALKRPARAAYPGERCCGNEDGQPCRFSGTEAGAPALIQPGRGQRRCAFCCDDTLEAVLARNGGEQVTKSLKAFLAFGDEKIFDLAVTNLRQRRGDAFADNFAAKAHKAKERQARGPRPAKLAMQQQWDEALTHRVRSRGGLPDDAMGQYQKVVSKDRALVRRKFFCPHMMKKHYTEANAALEMDAMPAPAADVLPNDAGLPATSISARAAAAEQWCKQGSWQACRKCHSLRPRDFHPGDLKRSPPATVKECGLCKNKVYVPQPEDVPEPLRNLSQAVLEALRPIDIDTGAYEKVPSGYRVHTSMICFSGAENDVEATRRELLRCC